MSGGSTAVASLRDRVAIAWAAGGRGRRVSLVIGGTLAAALAGAFLFGAWHIVFGGLVKGNWRAGGFGVALAAISASLLAGEAAVARSVLR